MERKPTDTVERMFLVGSYEGSNTALILGLLLGQSAVVARPTDSQNLSELISPSWLDFFQDS